MKIVVGSKNPVKIGAVEEAFHKYFPECSVEGGVTKIDKNIIFLPS